MKIWIQSFRNWLLRRSVWKLAILKVGVFQKKIGIIYRLKQICHFTILYLSFEFTAFFATWQLLLFWVKGFLFQNFKFKLVIWHIFLSPIKFSEKKATFNSIHWVSGQKHVYVIFESWLIKVTYSQTWPLFKGNAQLPNSGWYGLP